MPNSRTIRIRDRHDERCYQIFNDKHEELRVFRITDTRTVGGRQVLWKTEIENHVYKTKILIELLNMTLAQKTPDEAFERDYLKRIAVR